MLMFQNVVLSPLGFKEIIEKKIIGLRYPHSRVNYF